MDKNQHQTYLAIDPGASGGLAWITRPHCVTHCQKMPETEGATLELLRMIGGGIKDQDIHKTCYIEEVGGFIGKAQPGSAMFKFGFNAGLIRGMLMALGWRIILVRPAKWQAGLGLGGSKSCASKADWKRKLKGEAERRFPNTKGITLATADALLILDWGVNQ
jgi:hypothetical protein